MGFEYTTRQTFPGFFADAREPTRRAMRRIADRGGSFMTDTTIRNTSIGGRDLIEGPGFGGGRGGGNLRSSWKQKPVRPVVAALGGVIGPGEQGWESGVETDVKYAPFVEHGTGLWGPTGSKYLIEARPGKFLSWVTNRPIRLRDGTIIPAGTRVFRKRVWHPGSPGQHMVAIAVTLTEARMQQITDPILQRWVQECER